MTPCPSSENADNVGIILGYDWLKSYGGIGIEADYTTSFLDGSEDEVGVPTCNLQDLRLCK